VFAVGTVLGSDSSASLSTGDQTYESLARKGETMTTAAMVAYAFDQINAVFEIVVPAVVEAGGHVNKFLVGVMLVG
jgi:hypothetical protein